MFGLCATSRSELRTELARHHPHKVATFSSISVGPNGEGDEIFGGQDANQDGEHLTTDGDFLDSTHIQDFGRLPNLSENEREFHSHRLDVDALVLGGVAVDR